jgi:CRISPR-associated endoribonuclease Cas6
MRIRIKFSSVKGKIKIPVNYNYIIQSFIYNNISKRLSDFLHDKGYKNGKRSFKMFTFSRLQGNCRYLRKEKELLFKNGLSLWVSSPENDFLESYATELLNNQEINIGENKMYINSAEVSMTPAFREEMLIKMISPVTVYSTLEKKDGKKKTYYYHPEEPEFSELIEQNLKKKYKAYYKGNPVEEKFEIKPEKVTNRSRKIIYYEKKNKPRFIIKAWLGVYKIKGHPELMKLAWDSGIGAKNSQGFGMFEVVEK